MGIAKEICTPKNEHCAWYENVYARLQFVDRKSIRWTDLNLNSPDHVTGGGYEHVTFNVNPWIMASVENFINFFNFNASLKQKLHGSATHQQHE